MLLLLVVAPANGVASRVAGTTRWRALYADIVADLRSEYAALVRSRGIEAFRREWAHHPSMELRSGNPDMRALLAAMIERYPGNDLKSQATRAERAAARIRLEAIAAPALILSGEYDLPGRRQAAQQLAARLPDAELAVIPGEHVVRITSRLVRQSADV